ncbi:MAG: type IV pilus secretin PilQ [Desulfobacteraceae bacterium]|nr:type IV pilus secretin PilQ [Desulfobacteraceae bacterium]MBC2757005.1 type IV pilus secretin PilQ [Desulfobacteraceae bacterium]
MSGKKDAESVKADPQKIITGINTVVSADSESVIISANKQLNYTSVKQHDPLGVILLFPETTLGEIPPELRPDSEIIKTIIPSLSSDQKNTRLEIGLKEDLPYDVKKEGTNLNIVFLRPSTVSTEENQAIESSEMSAVKEESSLNTPVVAGSSEVTEEKTTEKKAVVGEQEESEKIVTSEVNKEAAVINRIDFSTQESGKSMIIVGTDFPVEFDIQKIAERTLKVRVYNSRLPEYRRHRPLITTRFESAVDRISPIQATDIKNATDLIVELREWVPYRPVAEDNLLTITFDPSSIGPRPFESANLPPWQQVLEEVTYSVQVPEAQAKEQAVVEDTYKDMLGGKKEYTGQKIALDFYKTDIKNVFRILQQVSGKNYAVDKNVTGEVTISLEKPAPWDQVLDLILQMNQLGKVEQDDIIRIATVATLSAEEVAQQKKIEAIRERREQEKTLEPLVTEYIPINYANAHSEILPHIQEILTKERGNITVDARNNQIIITDTRAKLRKAREIISQIDKVTPQVLIEARIVEVNDDFGREFGVAWSVSGEDIYKSGLDGQYSYNFAMNLPGTAFYADQAENGMQGATTLGVNFTRLQAWGTPIVLDAALRTMEQEGQGKIISSPKILTLDNQKAMIKQGQRIPYPTIEDGSVEINFEDVDLLLEVTPHVTPDHRISLHVLTTKNEIIGFTEPLGYPITSTNEAETLLLVDDGDTVVIGGVAKISETMQESGFPILKEIPMIGWLFKSKKVDNSNLELLIFLTPKIVQLEQRGMVQAEN